ncbi:MAG: hypothetical protein SO015_06160 [Wujia sp.]|nr:hypothetical protein [Wujia sp.]MDY3727724.1 hypothetical protein [Wujia sp.]
MKRIVKAIIAIMCVTFLLGSTMLAANPTAAYSFNFYTGEGRTIATSSVATKSNRNTYMTVRTASLYGSRSDITVYGTITPAGARMTVQANPPAVNGSTTLTYTQVIGVDENAYLCGFTDSRLACGVTGTFTP